LYLDALFARSLWSIITNVLHITMCLTCSWSQLYFFTRCVSFQHVKEPFLILNLKN